MNELTKTNAMPLKTVGDMNEMAETVAKSGLLGNSAPKAFVIIQHCAATGMSLLDFKLRWHVTEQGQVSMRSDRMLGEFQARGGKCVWTNISPEKATALFTANDNVDLEVSYTIEEAKAAGLVKGKSAWTTDPGAMCRARVITRGIRIVDPGSIAGVYEPSELPEEEVIEVEPGAEPKRAAGVKIDLSDGEAKAAAKPEKKPKKKPVSKADKAKPVVDVEVGPSPFEKKSDEEPVKPDFDYSVCPINGALSGVAWDDMDMDTLLMAKTIKDESMEPDHFKEVKKAIAKQGKG